MAATVKRVSLVSILPLIKTRLVTRGIYTTSQVREVIDDRLDAWQPQMGDHECLLRLAAEKLRPGYWQAAGAQDIRVDRTLRVTLLTRSELDQAGEAGSFLRDATVGHLAKEDAVIAALHGWHVTSSTNDEYTDAPLQYLNIDMTADVPRKPGWGGSVISFSVGYIREIPT